MVVSGEGGEQGRVLEKHSGKVEPTEKGLALR